MSESIDLTLDYFGRPIKHYDYCEFNDLPEFIRKKDNPEEYLFEGEIKLERYNGKFITKKRLSEIDCILKYYFGAKLDDKNEIRIYISEYKVIYIWFYRFRIRVYVDYD